MAQTDYERQKGRITRMRTAGIHRRSYHQCESDLKLLAKVKEQLTTATGKPATNDMALEHIFEFYQKHH